jgi:hypothetical protein
MAALQVDHGITRTSIRSNPAATSGDWVLQDAGVVSLSSTPASLTQFGRKTLSILDASNTPPPVIANARISGDPCDRSAGVPLALHLNRLHGAPTGPTGCQDSCGGGSFVYGQGGALTLHSAFFDEAGYRRTLPVVASSDGASSNNRFRRSSNRTVRASGEILQSRSGTSGQPTFPHGNDLDLPPVPQETVILANNSFDLSGVSHPTAPVGGSAPSLRAAAFQRMGANPLGPTTETRPTLSVDTRLNLSVVPAAGDTTSTAWGWVSAATDAVASGSVKIDARTGPTLSARYYGMLGSALYEAWQVFDSQARSSIAPPSSSPERWDRKVERLISSFFQRIGEEFSFDGGSTIGATDDDDRHDDGHNDAHDGGNDDRPPSPIAIRLMESVVARTAFAVLSSPLSGIQAGSAGLARLSQQLQTTLSTITPAETALFNGIDQQISQTVAARVLASFQNDGSSLSDPLLTNPITRQAPAYRPVNSRPNQGRLIDQWTPEYSLNSDSTTPLQVYLTPTWGDVQYYLFPSSRIHALTAKAKEPESFLLDANDTYNLPLGLIYDDGKGPGMAIGPDQIGKTINPAFINQANEVVAFNRQLTDPEGNYYKGIAQFWENGAGTSFPPGTWMKFGQYASLDHNNSLGDDAKLFFGLGASVYSASIAAWDLKLQYNYARPIRVIRDLSRFGLMEDGDQDPSNGSQFQAYVRGQGLQTINGTEWETYQSPGPYSPPFPEFVSGHSTFSSAAADFLTNFYGSGEFGGKVNFNLTFPYDPAHQAVGLAWDTWQGAAQEAGFSRLWGGIHFLDGNLEGQNLGAAIGSRLYDQLTNLWS